MSEGRYEPLSRRTSQAHGDPNIGHQVHIAHPVLTDGTVVLSQASSGPAKTLLDLVSVPVLVTFCANAAPAAQSLAHTSLGSRAPCRARVGRCKKCRTTVIQVVSNILSNILWSATADRTQLLSREWRSRVTGGTDAESARPNTGSSYSRVRGVRRRATVR
jgi:hypothetical protein